jgi:predicted Zn-dependent protease
MYKTGYDPNAFVSFFEKVEAEEKRRPGTVPTIFNTHPPTPDRVQAVQKNIANVLPARDQYIITTSEFDTVKDRLQRLENRHKLQDQKTDKPTLRTRTERHPPPPRAASSRGGITSRPRIPIGRSSSGATTQPNHGK